MAYNYQPKTSIIIPLKNSAEDEIIEIDFDSLPEGDEVLQILKGEHAALHYWLDLALEYYKAGRDEDFVKILQQCGADAGLDYSDFEKDQMRALDMLAAYYVLQGNKERNKEKRKDWFAKATLLYTTADKIIMLDQNHLLGRAYFCLLEGSKMDPGNPANPNQGRKAKMEQAKAQFDFVINQPVTEHQTNPRVIPAMMGKACIAFDEGRYKDALAYYKKCLRLNPNCPADVRVGMGYCLARLGKMEKARLAFERALEIDPTNVASIVALAILDLNTLAPEGYKSGLQSLSAVFQSEEQKNKERAPNDPPVNNPMVLNHLANHFFSRNDLDKIKLLILRAINLAENDAMKAESFYHLARFHHKKGNYTEAARFYYQSTILAHPKFILPWFGLGQMYIQQGDLEKAIIAFEKVLKMAPNNYETLNALGSLYASAQNADPKQTIERREKAREYLRKCVEMDPTDVDVLVELAQLLETNDPQGSLSLYLKVVEILEMENKEVPPEILNNAGTLSFMLNKLNDAKDYFQLARNSIIAEGVENLNDESTALLITISYNLGRVNEQLCLFDEAEKLYRQIIKQRPGYIDCILRLGCLIRDRGDMHNAMLLFKESMAGNPNSADPWTLIGNMHMAKNEWGPAQKKFEQILKMPHHHNDTYSFIALGNIWFELLSCHSSRNKEKDEVYRDRALAYYTKALKLRPQNIWAANGIGCVLAQKGAILDARDIFSQVREATADFPDVWINIANIYMEQKQYVSALQMYKNCMAKFNRFNDVQLISYVARAYWKAGRLDECRDCVERALIETPDNLIFRFNHAVILQKMATNVLRDEKSTSQEVTNAIEDLRVAERMFNFLSALSPDEIIRYKYISRTICGNEAGACSDLLRQAIVYLQRAQAKDEEERRQREQQEEQRRRLLAQQQEEERRQREEKLRELEKLKLQRQEFVDKTKEILKMPTIKEEKKPRPSASRKRREEERDDFVNDSSDLEFEEEGGVRREKVRRKRERPLGAVGGGSSDEGDAEAAERFAEKQRKRAFAKRKAMEREEDEILPARLRAKVKSKAFVSSSSSSASDNEQANDAVKSSESDNEGTQTANDAVKSSESDNEGAQTANDAVKSSESDNEGAQSDEPANVEADDGAEAKSDGSAESDDPGNESAKSESDESASE